MGNRSAGEGKTFSNTPSLVVPTCPLKVSSAVGCPMAVHTLSHSVAKRGLGRAWWLWLGWRDWPVGEGLWECLGKFLWLSLGSPLPKAGSRGVRGEVIRNLR